MASRENILAKGTTVHEEQSPLTDEIVTFVRHADGSGMKITRTGLGHLIGVWRADDTIVNFGEQIWWERIYPAEGESL